MSLFSPPRLGRLNFMVELWCVFQTFSRGKYGDFGLSYLHTTEAWTCFLAPLETTFKH